MILIYLISKIQTFAEDLVVDLEVPYNKPWYSGYLNAGQDKQFHYVFFQSQNNKEKDPLLLWLNGGPGCSSLDGMLYEHGPFMFSPMNKTFKQNDYAWNKLANVLYIQSPGSVGFSKGPIQNDDDQVSLDNLAALQSFFKKFPDYVNHDFYISGQSYGGIYVPFLANRIHHYNQKANQKINMKGWIVGNACTDPTQCYQPQGDDGFSRYTYQFFYKHAFYSDQDFKTFQQACNKDYYSSLCIQVKVKLAIKFQQTNTSIYNLYNPCYVDKDGKKPSRLLNHILTKSLKCQSQGAAIQWLNRNEVKQKLHVDTNITWDICNFQVNQKFKKAKNQSYWIYKALQGKYRIWIYSGDADGAVPLTGTKFWLDTLKKQKILPQLKAWRQWSIPGKKSGENQVGGMQWDISKLKLVTILGAGHMVPQDNNQAGYILLKSYLQNTDMP